MSETTTTLENVLEGIVRRVLKEEIGALKAKLNGHQDGLLLTPEKAAKWWSVPVSKIRDMTRRGELPSVKVGHYTRIRPSDLVRFIQERREDSSPLPIRQKTSNKKSS